MPTKRKSKLVTSNNSAEKIAAPIVANRYKVKKKLGSGSFGTVYLVLDLKTKNDLKVLKKIHIGKLEPGETVSAVSEARLLSKLDHPGIVKFHDSFVDGEFFCIITEYCEGGDLDVKLQSWKKTEKNVDIELVLTWFIQLVLAVQYMHQRRVLHRDLKTRNIFLKNNMVKIGDFGISRVLLGTTDIATTFTGTPYFMAPEILRHEGYNSKSDIWSLGVILYEMFTLKRAFQGASLMSVMFKIVECDVPELPPNIHQELKFIYRSMLCKGPRSRISATDILKEPYIISHLEKLKCKLGVVNKAMDDKLAKREAIEIARAIKEPQKPRDTNQQPRDTQHKQKDIHSTFNGNYSNSKRPLTPKEKMRLRKQQKADEEAERLKKVTLCTYNESRRQGSDIKERQTREHSFVEGEENDYNNFDKEVTHTSKQKNNVKDPGNNGVLLDRDYRRKDSCGFDEFTIQSDKNLRYPDMNSDNNKFLYEKEEETHNIQNNEAWLKAEHLDVFVSNYDDDDNADDDVNLKNEEGGENCLPHYTHCFGEEDETQNNIRRYTHCFGGDESIEEDNEQEQDNVFEEPFQIPDLTSISDIIPEEADVADTYYLTYNDFEVDEESDYSSEGDEETGGSASANGEYGALMDHMQNALDLSEDDTQSMFGDVISTRDSCTSIREQKISALRKECIKSLGEEGFTKVYEFLKKVRFESDRNISEHVIMKHLRKIAGSSRDCFLVDQLLFLEKQNQISKETF